MYKVFALRFGQNSGIHVQNELYDNAIFLLTSSPGVVFSYCSLNI